MQLGRMPNSSIRQTLFWLHLAAGVTAGLVILLMSVTGVLLAFERQIVAFADRDFRATAAEAAGAPLPLSRVLAAAVAAAPDGRPSNVVVRSDRFAPVAVSFGRERTLFVNPYSGAVLGEGGRGVRAFFEANKSLHRWLAMKGEGRERGKAITGAANLAFLFIVLSGLVIWIPRRRTRTGFRNAMLFRRGLRGRARDFNWHHVLGIWAFLPLVAIVFSAVVISYPWASRLVYRAFGSTPPEQQQPSTGRGGGKLDLAGLDRLSTVARNEAGRVAPAWQSLSVRLPLSANAPVAFALDEGNGGRPDKRSQLMIDARTARVVEHKTYAQQESGQQARSWLRWIHTGEAGGILGQFVAMLASAAAVVLVYTGLALALRRFARLLRGAPAPSQQLVEEESNA
ncbi:MAG TPA: PepSY-associated TM helix domain-containing protein [Thermoanaerobaculia bacterium]|nr:PepSY-associated TM helix domain-containing protein [Thermoanaerobaculia bacterium]